MVFPTISPNSLNHGRLRDLFERTADLPADRLSEAFAAANASDVEIRCVNALLEADREAIEVLNAPVTAWVRRLEGGQADDKPLIDQRVGPYRIVDVLGRGGSSMVFRATRLIGDATQTVALKLLHTGMFSPAVRRRFRREQTILNEVSHPNIARLIDGGVTETGIPYIAMEEVDGTDLLSHADQNSFGTDDRLRLIVDVCRAVDAAHRALVVHRDLKPSNVLVTKDGIAKVLDFGIAKLLEDDKDDLATATMHVALTPGYAAPEQYEKGCITTATDVYALGVLLGELLLGVRLGPDASWDEVEETSRTFTRQRWQKLDGELVDILRTALAREPNRRYSSAGHLADDVGRYLRREPIAARPPSRWYLARKFVSRNRTSASIAALVLLAIVVSLGVTLWQQNLVRRQAARADSMRDFIFNVLVQAEPTQARGAPATILDAVEKGIATLSQDRSMDPAARIELLAQLGEVMCARGDLEHSGVILQNVRDQAIALLGPDAPLTLEVEQRVEYNLFHKGAYAAARSAVDSLLTRVSPDAIDLRVKLLIDSSQIALKMADRERALRDSRAAIELSRQSADGDLYLVALKMLSSTLLATGNVDEAIRVDEGLLQRDRERFGDESDQVSILLATLSRAYAKTGDLDRAEADARASVAIDRKIYRADHWLAAQHLRVLGLVLVEKGDLQGGADAYQDSLRIAEATLGPNHPDVTATLRAAAAVDRQMGNDASAAVKLSRALAIDSTQAGDGGAHDHAVTTLH